MKESEKKPKGRPPKCCSGDSKLRGAKLKATREYLHKTQAEMASILECSVDQVSKEERAVKGREIDDQKAYTYSQRLNIVPELFTDDSINLETFKARISTPKDSLSLNIPHNLPRVDYEFIGRDEEITALLQYLCPESRQFIISITGVGGVGKSSLAIEVAKRCIELYYFDAVIWTSAKKELLIGNTVQRIGFVKSNLGELLTKIIEILDPESTKNLPSQIHQISLSKKLLSEKKALLIIDNMETVEDDQVRIFLDDIPSPSKVIITDRRSVQSSKALQLKELSEEESLKIIKEQCSIHGFNLSKQQESILAKITGGIPLAIKWATGQIASQCWDTDMLSKHLCDNKESPILDFLFNNSFQKLTTNSKNILFSLAKLPIPVTGSSLSKMNNISENDTKDSLSQLLQYALLSESKQPACDAPSSYFIPMLERTYSLLPLTKNFLSRKINIESSILSKKIILYLFNKLKSVTSNPDWPSSESIEFVSKNRELLVWAMEESFRIEEYDLVINIMKYIGYSLGIKGQHDIRLKLGEMALEAAKSTNDTSEQSRNLLLNIGWVYFIWYDFAKCEECVNGGISLAKQAHNKWLEAVGIRTLALVRKEQNKHEEALGLLLQSIDMFKKSNGNHFLAVTLGSLASLSRDMGEYEDAYKYLEQAILIAENLEGNDEIISIFKQKLTKLLIVTGKLDEAEICNKEALFLSQKIKRPVGEAYYEHNMALINEKLGKIDKAFLHVEKAASLFFSFGSKNDILKDYERIKALNSRS